ncbi:hypothetical protein Bpfe_002607, partial [Biomphalaria pfeifferi]
KTLYKINGRPEMCVVELSVAPGVHDLYSSTQASYLCYLYGNEGQKLYMHPAGYTIEVKSD